uniref:peptidylprolyl isomerase n=1 Tax=Chromera velia CCMP2878 TaxID=1169474 RepID=A0A0G4HNZ8_9ALVE|eukprot:Cvel_29748.t1-p1 / transcript=Cvel_29748.t1 / gene=Cvel_29748 / organism=Chromera_velia_CCMP2878 / gene_product=hypothetical protein / transcript_product=hypothetical protein / location=Cvel_scaffold4130:3722-5923(-) / protein_length=535 / sequence_SO=supercontig / SO=protein_coding / is_pseudo=false
MAVPVHLDQIDFGLVDKTNDVKKLKNFLKILEEDGAHYPELQAAIRAKLSKLDPLFARKNRAPTKKEEDEAHDEVRKFIADIKSKKPHTKDFWKIKIEEECDEPEIEEEAEARVRDRISKTAKSAQENTKTQANARESTNKLDPPSPQQPKPPTASAPAKQTVLKPVEEKGKEKAQKETETQKPKPPTPEEKEEKAPAVSPVSKIESLKEKGNCAFREKRFDDALSLFAEAADTCKAHEKDENAPFLVGGEKYALLHSNIAQVRIMKKEWGAAIDAASAALSADPSNIKARYRRALATLEKETETPSEPAATAEEGEEKGDLGEALRDAKTVCDHWRKMVAQQPQQPSVAAPSADAERLHLRILKAIEAAKARRRTAETQQKASAALKLVASKESALPPAPRTTYQLTEQLSSLRTQSGAVRASYFRERLSPPILLRLFKTTAIEDEDLCALISGIHEAALSVPSGGEGGSVGLPHETAAELLTALLSTHNVDFPLSMLAGETEGEKLGELVKGLQEKGGEAAVRLKERAGALGI